MAGTEPLPFWPLESIYFSLAKSLHHKLLSLLLTVSFTWQLLPLPLNLYFFKASAFFLLPLHHPYSFIPTDTVALRSSCNVVFVHTASNSTKEQFASLGLLNWSAFVDLLLFVFFFDFCAVIMGKYVAQWNSFFFFLLLSVLFWKMTTPCLLQSALCRLMQLPAPVKQPSSSLPHNQCTALKGAAGRNSIGCRHLGRIDRCSQQVRC